VAHLGVEPEIFFVDRRPEILAELEKKLRVRRPYLLFVGWRFGAYKNFRRLLDAFALVGERHHLTLVVAGEEWSKTEQAFMETYEAKRRLLLIENPHPDVLRSLYNFTTAFVFPSLWEGFGLPLVEAMACGTVIIASSTEIFREVGGDVPIYFNPSDTEDLARAIEVVAKGDALHELAARGILRARSFSWDRCAEKFHSVYAKVRSSNRWGEG
jgi:glycosyltransferase involved in cell wall biosynthesis